MNILDLIKDLNFTNMIWQILTPMIFNLADVITGYIQAVIRDDVKSKIMRKGLYHKILLILIEFLSFIFGLAFNLMIIPGIVCTYIVIMEIVSIVENLKKAGIDIGWLSDNVKDKTEDSTQESINKSTDTIEKKEEKKE